MPLHTVRAFLHNETKHTLIKISDECPSGDWTTPAPVTIGPGTVAMMRAESEFLGGVESRVTYVIDGTPDTLYIHWNNPLSGANSYHTNTGDGHTSFWSAPTTGSNPIAHFYLRPAVLVETDFLPSRDSFRFDNGRLGDLPYTLPPLRGSILDQKYGTSKKGLCGGMVLAALDYFAAANQIPDVFDISGGETDPLFLHIVDRLFDTFSLEMVSLMLKVMAKHYPDGDANVLGTFGLASGRAAIMAHQEWPLIRNDLDAGRPSPMCLVNIKSYLPFDLGENHQVLAYAYTATGHDIVLNVYDPNKPRNDSVTMRFNVGDVSNRIVVDHNLGIDGSPVYCFFHMNNLPKPIPYPTQPRLTPQERKWRRVRVFDRGSRENTRTSVARGRASFPVMPKCGDHAFDYSVDHVSRAYMIDAETVLYLEPRLRWWVNGFRIVEGPFQTLFVPADAERPELAPVGWPILPEESGADRPPPPGTVVIRAVLWEGHLELFNDPRDGNYQLAIKVEADEPTEGNSTTSRTIIIDVQGCEVVVDGLAEANAECWRDFLKRQMAFGGVDAKSVASMLYAQLRRPLDPLWDPDYSTVDLGLMLTEDDPTIVELKTLAAEVSAATPGTSTTVVTAPAGLDLTTIDAGALHQRIRRFRLGF